MKLKGRVDSAIELTAGGEDKMNQIVDEVDRFFKAFHADIEDWKFSMEDYGDGTRIFVRFQIHLNNAGVEVTGREPAAKQPAPSKSEDAALVLSARVESTPSKKSGLARNDREPDGSTTASRADMDLASFVDHWRTTRAKNGGGEFHKEGAPYMDEGSGSNESQRTRGEPRSGVARRRTDEKARIPDASP